ncbi:MAG: ABC transporter permease [Saprospiraceae bacterium]|nr:ABC transporter permease [Saprospiraceae bacterium]MBK7738843.1 ABC transporter permease [Saprospiraceae bacterium]MBK7912586.1 ABC transporter permease [Saprospiraceae bacterium]
MVSFIFKRIGFGIFSLILVLYLSCWLIRLIPGSYNEIMLSENAGQHESQTIDPVQIPLFYFSWIPSKTDSMQTASILPQFWWNGVNNNFHNKLTEYLSGDFGRSVVDQQAVSKKFKDALPWSLSFQLPAIGLILCISIWLGRSSVMYPKSIGLKIINSCLIWIHAIPVFWLASLLLLFFANPDFLKIFPSGMQSLSISNPWLIWIQQPEFMILPLVCFIIPSLAYLSRLIKNGMEEVTHKFYWIRALSSGMSYRQALKDEAFPVVMVPLIAWIGSLFPALISGSLIIEQIFSIPGLGRLMYHSISVRDWPQVQFLLLLGSALTIFGFLISDILYRIYNPQLDSKA